MAQVCRCCSPGQQAGCTRSPDAASVGRPPCLRLACPVPSLSQEAPAQVFSFPTLSEADLLSCLRDMELPLTAAQLAKPAPEFIVPLYETFVTTLGGVSRHVPARCTGQAAGAQYAAAALPCSYQTPCCQHPGTSGPW